MTHQPALGRRLKALRVSRGLSLKEVGAATGVSSSFISMVETGRNDLSVGRLMMLAEFYGVGLGDILPARDTDQPVVLRRAERKAVDPSVASVTTEPLASWPHGDVATGFRRFDIGAELAEAGTQAGPAFLFVLSGELMIDFAEQTQVVLGEGDSVWFEASRRHRQVNVGDGAAEVVTFKNLSRPDV
ncbi:MAG TPA: XRE family transcriptional regulator [Solirubrobacterales bacterium]|nr:XRE family transcriptional regulator [Solirubrobacterales bacterium]